MTKSFEMEQERDVYLVSYQSDRSQAIPNILHLHGLSGMPPALWVNWPSVLRTAGASSHEQSSGGQRVGGDLTITLLRKYLTLNNWVMWDEGTGL